MNLNSQSIDSDILHKKPTKKIACVLFDLDGTLVDSMGDLTAALSQYLASIGVTDFNPAQGYQVPVHSATSFLSMGLGREPTNTELHDFIKLYADMPRTYTHEYAKVDELLASLLVMNLPWGIITNKPRAIAEEEVIHFGYHQQAICCIYGDTLAVKKPDPAPLLLGAEQANVAAVNCVYIGDSASDIDAGIRAGMMTIAVAYGYSNADKLKHADWCVDSVEQLHQLINTLIGC